MFSLICGRYTPIHIKHYHISTNIQNLFAVVGLLEETRGGVKEEEKNIETYGICVRTRSSVTHGKM
jgi:hypothetical protein